MEKLVILGSGPAGFTAAIYAARANLSPLLYMGAVPGGLLTQTTDVENFPGFPDAVNGFELVYNMQQQAEKFGTRIEMAKVDKVEFIPDGPQKLFIEDGTVIEAEAVIIATGAQPRWLNLPEEDKYKNHGVSACATCDGAFYRGKKVAVVGGGDSAMEEANFLSNFAEHITVIVRRDVLRASQIMIERAKKNPKISFIYNTVVSSLIGGDKLTAVKLHDNAANTDSTLEIDGLFVAMGHQPSTELFKGQIELDEQGYIKLACNSSRTSMSGVFAAGDCADPVYRQAITAAGMGCKAGMDAERFLANK